MQEAQNLNFMKKFSLLSDVNICIGNDFKDPDFGECLKFLKIIYIEIPVKSRQVI